MFGDENSGGFDMNALMQQAQAMQQQLARAQEELGGKEVDGSAGGDLVTVKMTGTGELLEVHIKPEACDPEDTESLGDLIVAAVRDASHKATALAESAMPQMPF